MSTCPVDRHKLLCNTLFATPNFHLSSVGGGCHWLQLALVVIFHAATSTGTPHTCTWWYHPLQLWRWWLHITMIITGALMVVYIIILYDIVEAHCYGFR